MINKNEIDQKAKDFDINSSNVQRDYVFSWILAGMYAHSNLKDKLVLKGGNCLRKVYFENTRFSSDLDFSCKTEIPVEDMSTEFSAICDFVFDQTGIIFNKEKTIIQPKKLADGEKTIYDIKLYFDNFYGESGKMDLKVDLDVSTYDKIYLPVQERAEVHTLI